MEKFNTLIDTCFFLCYFLSFSKSGFICMMFYRRDTHVAELQIGREATRLEDSCAPDYFDMNRLPYISLLGKL